MRCPIHGGYHGGECPEIRARRTLRWRGAALACGCVDPPFVFALLLLLALGLAATL